MTINEKTKTTLNELFARCTGSNAVEMNALQGAGSNRAYYRLRGADGQTLIGVEGTSVEENRAFVYLSRHFQHLKLPVPQVLAVSQDDMCYLQTDLGSCSLFDAIRGGREAGGRYNAHEKALLLKTIRALPELQTRGARELDWNKCYPQPCFDVDNVLFDLNYFKYCFLKATEVDFHELKLEADFRLFAKDLVNDENTFFMYRDFQARNIMLDAQENPVFIDFQGGRRGPLYYDVASFLWQSSARYSNELRRRLIVEYYNTLKHYTSVPSMKLFLERLALFVLFRNLQVLGAYGFRGFFERKAYFIQSIPWAIDNLRALLQWKNMFPYPYLVTLLNKLVSLPQFVSQANDDAHSVLTTAAVVQKTDDVGGVRPVADVENDKQKRGLKVRVFSFSYKKGIPEDTSGNGGGYVFDCRSTHNPGRYAPYKQLTGLDEPVIRFLEDDGEILTFLEHVYALADKHVERYLERGFTNLMFAFGCTGGQHRSVYSAQHLAQHLHKKYGVEVQLLHREQGIEQHFAAK